MRLLADVDTGIDDALALAWLVRRAEVDLVGVTTTAGNTTAEQAALNSLAVLEIAGRGDVEVCVGTLAPLVVPLTTTPETHGVDGLGYARLPDVSDRISARGFLDLWADAVDAGPTSLLVSGPLTNLAVAIEERPDVVERFEQIVVMGGSFDHPGNTTPSAEWNSWVDPHAAARVYSWFEGRDRLPLVCGLQITEQIEIGPDVLAALEARRSDPLAALLADALRFYVEFHVEWGYGEIAQVHDLAAAMVAVGAVVFEAPPVWVGVEADSELTRGTTVRDGRLLWKRPPNARVVTSLGVAGVLGEIERWIGELNA